MERAEGRRKENQARFSVLLPFPAGVSSLHSRFLPFARTQRKWRSRRNQLGKKRKVGSVRARLHCPPFGRERGKHQQKQEEKEKGSSRSSSWMEGLIEGGREGEGATRLFWFYAAEGRRREPPTTSGVPRAKKGHLAALYALSLALAKQSRRQPE